MNYAATIGARLGVETKPFSDGMNKAANDGQRAGDRIAASTNRAAGAHDNLIMSSHRAGHNIANVAREMINGADATTVFGTGLEALGRVLKVSLGVIAGLFVGGMIAIEIAKASKEMTKLHNEIARLGDTSDLRLEAFDKLSARLTEIRKKMVELDQAFPKPGRWVTLSQIWNTLAHPIDSLRGQPETDASTLRKANRATLMAEAYRRARDNKSQSARDGGDPFKADRMKAYDEAMPKVRAAFFDKNMALAAEELRNYANTIKEINKKEQEHLQKISTEKEEARTKHLQGIKESMQLSLADLAKNGRDFAPGDDSRAGGGKLARRALEEEALARKEMLAEHYDEALKHRNRAEEIKNSIPGLKDSEKDMASAVQRGNDASAVLRMIAENTAGRLVNR
jgi:hypothetical protein